MSEMQLSQQLVDAVQGAIVAHDPRAEDDMIAVQYLAAIIGMVMGNKSISSSHKQQVLEQLSAFTRHVVLDIERQNAPPQEAFGIWKPEKKPD